MRLIVHLLLCCTYASAATTAAALQVDAHAVGDWHTAGQPVVEVPEQEAFQGGCVTLSQAVAQVRRQYNGKIVSAVTQVSGNRETHIIKVLTQDGKVKTVRVAGCRR